MTDKTFTHNGPLILPNGIPKQKPMTRDILGEPPTKPKNWCARCKKHFTGRLEEHICPNCEVRVYHRLDKKTGIILWRCGLCGQVVEPKVRKTDGISHMCPQCQEKLDDLIDAQSETPSGNLPAGMVRATKATKPVTRMDVRTQTFGEVTSPKGQRRTSK